ncbi:MAG: 1-deoxy-D-xylulose-5-phosphate reductoisomerase [Bacteroidia bacterium]|nr:1-deoxy-D-xylulose-5-phosphate reductoisomerase [Bacteroidia bacterium]MDW8157342.1 1-deoxy-D-xylulose-5-phosphate reductoisomerase [Bacteroidia bacterium]
MNLRKQEKRPVKSIAILGSTGSIGRQSLEVIKSFPNLLKATVLTAHSNDELLIQQAKEFLPNAVVIGESEKWQRVKEELAEYPIEVLSGQQGLLEVVRREDVDCVLVALVGAAGLLPTYAAIEARKQIALANKETLVIAGALIMNKAKEKAVSILPVDSEHSAIFQCLVGEARASVQKIYLTASGGPFRGFTIQQLEDVSPSQALKHPNWQMGRKISIDSATLVNKGLEIIEARWLFDTEAIDVVIHPQSVIHSLVCFVDGSLKAQLGTPDMRIPIQYALTYPNRCSNSLKPFSFQDFPSFTFEAVNHDVFKGVVYARHALERGGNVPCILNAANEIAVELFLQMKIKFLEIYHVIEKALVKIPFIANPSLAELLETDIFTREFLLQHYQKI